MTKPDQNTTEQMNSEKNNESDLLACQQEVSEWKDKYIHLAADFQNFKKRLEKDRVNWEHSTQKKIFLPLISILDDFDRAIAQEKKSQMNPDQMQAWLTGFTMIAKEFGKVLEGFGVKPMTEFTKFDPEFHEALSQIASDNHKSDEIIEVLQKGYMLNDTVLRPAKVVVAE